MIRVLYAGAADLARPNSGLDMASRSLFEEISVDERLAITAISVSPQSIDPAVPARYPVQLFESDMLTLSSGRARLLKKIALLARGGILFHSGLISDRARLALRTAVADKPDVLLIDNVSALGNIALLRLLAVRLGGRSKIMVIAHDATADVLRDRAGLQSSRLKAFALRLHARHCRLYESAVFTLAHLVVFLSESDRRRFPRLPASKTDTKCLIVDEPADEQAPISDPAFGRYLIFIGSPSFFANAYAIDWLTTRLAPMLLARMPAVKILLVGKGTDRMDGERPDNVVGLGFVDEARLHYLLRGSVGLLSPVIHGSGIKIKVFEAIACGCAIFAAGPSLRGYEFMGLEPLLDIDDPSTSVDRVCAVVDDPARLAAYQQQIRGRWEHYKRQRRGQLADTVHRLATTDTRGSAQKS